MALRFNPLTGQLDLVGGGSSGANTTLSNLGTTAINADLTFANGATRTIKTAEQGVGEGSSDDLIIETGLTEDATSGILNIGTGQSTNSPTGALNIYTGGTAASVLQGTGNLSIKTGDFSDAANNGTTGSIIIQSGLADTLNFTGGSGQVDVGSGYTYDGNSGITTLYTGDTAGTGVSGDIYVFTGYTAAGNSGNLDVATGDSETAITGYTQVRSGSVTGVGSTTNSGVAYVFSGTTAGSGNSGDVEVFTGAASGTGDTGLLNIYTGDSTAGASGGVSIFTGAAGTTRGNITLDANKVSMVNVDQGFTVPVIAGDPSSPVNGDVWYNSSTHKLRVRANGANVDLH